MSSGSTTSRRAGRKVTFVLGNQLRRTCAVGRRESGERSGPSILTAVIVAPLLSAIIAAPTKTLVNEPVTALRPSGNSTSRRPSRALVTSSRAAIGLAGSSRRASHSFKNWRIHQRRASAASTTSSGRPSSSDRMIGRVEQRDVIDGDDVARTGGGNAVDADDFEPQEDPPQRAQRKDQEVGRQAAEEIDRGGEIGDAEQDHRSPTR